MKHQHKNPFPNWLPDVITDEIVVDPGDINREALGNLWTFSLTPDQAESVTTGDVETFARAVEEARSMQVIRVSLETMNLYWWHDPAAGQLRFSLVSTSHGRLPFACDWRLVQFLLVIEDWLGSPYLHGIPWNEVSWVTDDDGLEPKRADLLVSITEIGLGGL